MNICHQIKSTGGVHKPVMRHPVIAVAGPTCSGKTEFITPTLVKMFEYYGIPVTLIQADNYYCNLDQLSKDNGTLDASGNPDWDVPGAMHLDELARDILLLKTGCCALSSVYDFRANMRTNETLLIQPKPGSVILVEGVWGLHNTLFDQGFEGLIDFSIFVWANEETRLERKIERDRVRKNFSPQEIREIFLTKVLPGDRNYLYPTITRANMIVTNN